jgi:hypothetical protein
MTQSNLALSIEEIDASGVRAANADVLEDPRGRRAPAVIPNIVPAPAIVRLARPRRRIRAQVGFYAASAQMFRPFRVY